jgi:hypothetical protein
MSWVASNTGGTKHGSRLAAALLQLLAAAGRRVLADGVPSILLRVLRVKEPCLHGVVAGDALLLQQLLQPPLQLLAQGDLGLAQQALLSDLGLALQALSLTKQQASRRA